MYFSVSLYFPTWNDVELKDLWGFSCQPARLFHVGGLRALSRMVSFMDVLFLF